MSQANGLSIYEEIEQIQEQGRVKFEYMRMLRLSKMTVKQVSVYCAYNSLDKQRTVKSVIEFMRMPNNNDRLFYLECRKALGLKMPPIGKA